MNTKETGFWGEKIAENYLKKKGYLILDKNYSTNFNSGPNRGEIDLIAKKSDTIIFVEVKTIRGERVSPFSPEEKVDFQKKKKIIKMAEAWLMKKRIPLDSRWQIDVIAVKINSAHNSAELQHFKNAASGSR